MAHLAYYNRLANVTEIFYDEGKDLIEKICIELNASDKIDEMIDRYLDNSVKLKPKKDRNQPKRPKTSYMFYCDETRPTVVKKNPKFKLGDVSKAMGKEWKKLNDKKKEKFVKLAEADKKRYEEEMEAYQNKLHMTELMAYQEGVANTTSA